MTEFEHSLTDIAMIGYIGESCVVCGHVYSSLDDMNKREPVRANWNVPLELACEKCYEE